MMKKNAATLLYLLLALSNQISAFSVGQGNHHGRSRLYTTTRSTTRLYEDASDDAAVTSTKPSKTEPSMPQSYAEMVRQVASAMRDAYNQKIDRQIVRVLLPRDTSSKKLGVLSEGILDVDAQNIVLVPPDESWQGGIMQLYRSAAPTCKDALRYVLDHGS
jgi:hypothetical protein